MTLKEQVNNDVTRGLKYHLRPTFASRVWTPGCRLKDPIVDNGANSSASQTIIVIEPV